MQFLHQREYLNEGDVVVVDCSHRCNIRLMSDSDFASYRRGGSHRYYGGHYERLPARIVVPSRRLLEHHAGSGGGSASIRHSIMILKAA